LKKFISITMVVLFLLTVITGIVTWRTNATDGDIHTVCAVLFTLVTVTHIILHVKGLKKAFYIIHVILLIVSTVSGLVEAHVHPGEAGAHVIISLLFVVLMIAHIKANWKALSRHCGFQNKTIQKTMEER
jgi:hypothetical protein